MSDLAPFTFDFTPTLKTREMIKATVYFVVDGHTLNLTLAIVNPWASPEPAEEDIRQKVFADADSVANRWGLQFPSADAALDLSSYVSLTRELSAIASPDFTIKKLVVRNIIALSERVPKSQEVPIADKRTRGEKFTDDLDDDEMTLDQLDDWVVRSHARNPGMWSDPATADLMMRKVEHKKRSILLSGRL